MNSIVKIADWNPDGVCYMLMYELFVNGIKRGCGSVPPRIRLKRRYYGDIHKQFFKYSYSSHIKCCYIKRLLEILNSENHSDYAGNSIPEKDCEIIKKRFLKYGVDVLEIEPYKLDYGRGIHEYKYEIHYCYIEKALLPYLKHKKFLSNSFVHELGSLFVTSNNEYTYDEYVRAKTDELMSIDLDSWLESSNKKISYKYAEKFNNAKKKRGID